MSSKLSKSEVNPMAKSLWTKNTIESPQRRLTIENWGYVSIQTILLHVKIFVMEFQVCNFKYMYKDLLHKLIEYQ